MDGENEIIKPDTELQQGGAATAVSDESNTASEEKTADNSIDEMAAINERQRLIEEQDKKLLAALDEALERRSVKVDVKPQPKVGKIAKGVAKKGVGFVSLAFTLILMGIVMIVCLFSPAHDFSLPLKLSPLCAVFIGLEILANHMLTHGHFRINIPSMAISALLVAGCCIMCVSLGNNMDEKKEEYNNRSVSAEIYDMSYRELRHVADIASLEVEVDLDPYGSGAKNGLEALSSDDIVNINVRFAGVIKTPREFASNCKKIIDGYRIMGISVTNFHFVNESALHSFKLDVEGRFAQDFSESRLLENVVHIYLDNMQYIEDLEDIEYENSGS